MQTRKTHRPPSTLARAKREFKTHGPRMSSQEARQLARGAELLARAEQIKAAERKRKENAKKRREKEMRERDARRRQGLPSQDFKGFCRVGSSQCNLVGFVRIIKPEQGASAGVTAGEKDAKPKSTETAKSLECGAESEPWDAEDLDEGLFLDSVRSVRPHPSPSRQDERYHSIRHFPTWKKTITMQQAHRPADGDVSIRGVPDLKQSNPRIAEPPLGLFEDFIPSNTQVAREIDDVSPIHPACRMGKERAQGHGSGSRNRHAPAGSTETQNVLCGRRLHNNCVKNPELESISTQDVNLSPEDLKEIGGVDQHSASTKREQMQPSQQRVNAPLKAYRGFDYSSLGSPSRSSAPRKPNPCPTNSVTFVIPDFDNKSALEIDSKKVEDRLRMPPPVPVRKDPEMRSKGPHNAHETKFKERPRNRDLSPSGQLKNVPQPKSAAQGPALHCTSASTQQHCYLSQQGFYNSDDNDDDDDDDDDDFPFLATQDLRDLDLSGTGMRS